MGKTVYFVTKPDVNRALFFDETLIRNQISRPYVYLRKQIENAGYQFIITHDCSDLDNVAAIISLGYENRTILYNISRYPLSKRILLILEPSSLLPLLYHPRLKKQFGTIFTMLDDFVDEQSYFKIHHPIPLEEPLQNTPYFDQKKLCVMILSNLRNDHPLDLYRERANVASLFPNNDEFDLYGIGWDGFPTWKGGLGGDQFSVLKNYRFCFAYENTRDLPGYITERIFNAFFCRCVPIYWGAPNITDYVPKTCFIDRREFSSNPELYRFIKSIDRKAYHKYIEAAQHYLKSSLAKLFFPQNFAQTIMNRLIQVIES